MAIALAATTESIAPVLTDIFGRQASDLQLSIDDLALPMSETVTAGARVRRQRDTSMARRLAFDLLQRQVRGVDEYLPTPSLPSAWLDSPSPITAASGPTERLIHSRPAGLGGTGSRGWQRLAEVRNLELLRGLFRRPLELWLNSIEPFSSRTGIRRTPRHLLRQPLTPRNFLLLAERA
jgi:hypothetical protein